MLPLLLSSATQLMASPLNRSDYAWLCHSEKWSQSLSDFHQPRISYQCYVPYWAVELDIGLRLKLLLPLETLLVSWRREKRGITGHILAPAASVWDCHTLLLLMFLWPEPAWPLWCRWTVLDDRKAHYNHHPLLSRFLLSGLHISNRR